MPLCSRMRLALISGITSGTFGSMRKAEELSMTTAPALTATGANFREMPPPAENSAISTPAKEFSRELLDHDPLAAEVDGLAGRARARQRLELADAKCALVHGGDEFGADGAGHAGNGNNGIVLHFGLHQHAIKKPRTFSGGASGSDDAIVDLRAHASRGPGGPCGFRGAFGGRHHGAGLCGRFGLASTGFGRKIGINEVEQDVVVTR